MRHQAVGDEKAISGYAQRRMMMKAAPAASLEVPQAEFLLELLMIALNAPAQFCKSHEFPDRRVSRQRAEEVFGRLELFAGPLDEQPLFLGGLSWLGWAATIILSDVSRCAAPAGQSDG